MASVNSSGGSSVVQTVHCFEQAGLGKAPFRYVGMEDQSIAHGQRVIGTVGGALLTTKPGGSCAYCGTYIVNMFNVESADGNRFHVGCECIRKTGDRGLIQLVESDLKAYEIKKRNAKRLAKEQADRTICVEQLADVSVVLAGQPHPSPRFAEDGATLLDYVRWMIANKHYKGAAAIVRKAKGGAA